MMYSSSTWKDTTASNYLQRAGGRFFVSSKYLILYLFPPFYITHFDAVAICQISDFPRRIYIGNTAIIMAPFG